MADEPTAIGWVASAISGIAAGFLSAVSTVAWLGGDVKATLKAHDQRLTTLENDIRYEIRALRDRVESTSANIHALRNELMAMLNRRPKSDEFRERPD